MSNEYKKHEGKGALHQGHARSAPYPVSRLGANVELVDLVQQIATADSHINTRVSAKLQVIADQIRNLQAEAREVLESAQRDQDLHRAQCNFKRIPGRTYHLYQRNDGSNYFSMLGPDDWGGRAPHEFQGSYRLENDMSWTPADQVDMPDDSRELVRRLLGERS
ncbi:hypothetical protein Tel_03155 [Candidatus Tenderia electrophaga]|jgi:hypothetical protein|uniref:DUF2452 domain-containing protein n=1 Tax=Candidatus Tenderia electrophaga TaxID=1748243 RepID=A0A0S2TAR3_9GAMM|nr:hypothetical protein Tel_03155 [Candidatus Tenderia electrophaga]